MFIVDDKKAGKIKKITNYYFAWKKLIKIIKKERIDILHMQWLSFSPLDYYFIKKAKRLCKIVFTIHDIEAFDKHKYDKRYYHKIYSLVNQIIIQTENNIERFKILFPEISCNKLNLAYHGHFLDFSTPKEKEDSRERLSIPKDKFVFLFFGQIKKVKGLDLLLNAFSRLLKDCNDVFLVIAGNVWKNTFKPYQKIIDDNKINGNVMCNIGFIPDDEVCYYFSSADVCCLPYTELYQSGVIQLSYSYKKPAIVSDLPAFLTVVRDKKNGFVFENNNIHSLYEKMLEAYSCKSLSEMGDIGFEFVKQKYDWNIIAKKTIDIYQRALNGIDKVK